MRVTGIIESGHNIVSVKFLTEVLYLDAEFDQTGKKFKVWEMRWLYVQKDRLTQPFENFKISTFTQTALQMPDLPYLCLFNSNKNKKMSIENLTLCPEAFSIQLPLCRIGLVSQNCFKTDLERNPIFGLAAYFFAISSKFIFEPILNQIFKKKISRHKNNFIFEGQFS